MNEWETAAPGGEQEQPLPRGRRRRTAGTDRARIIEEVRRTEFPAAVRGYDRAAVDRYVEQVTNLIAELEISSSSDAAVEHALAEISDETREILMHAQQSAQQIEGRSRARAEDRLAQAESQADEMVSTARREAEETRDAALQEARQWWDDAQRAASELRDTAEREVAELRETAAREVAELRATALQETTELRAAARHESGQMLEAAENRVRELADSADIISHERQRLLEAMTEVGEQLIAIGRGQAERFPEAGGQVERFPEAGEQLDAEQPLSSEQPLSDG